MNSFCDLHTHSHYSDGTYSPEQLIQAAREIGLSAVALTDHNTVDGLPEFVEAARNTPVEAVPGVEFSTEYGGRELHILGLFIEPRHYDAVNARLDQFLQQKNESNKLLVENLCNAGLDLNYEKIKEEAAGFINRAVIGAEMVRLGYCESVKAAFSQWLSEKKGYYRPPVRPDAFETIGFIKSLGCAAVLAHPLLSMDEETTRKFLDGAVPCGLDGMEAYYSTYDIKTTALAKALAVRYGILESGGSDFHGGNKPDISIGIGRGDLRVSADLLEMLKNKIKIRK